MQPKEEMKSTASTSSSKTKTVVQSHLNWISLNMILYTGISLLVGLYSSYVIAPDLFRSYANDYHVIKYLEKIFNAVDEFSPFHEFINDSNSGNDFAMRDKIFTKEELKEYDGHIAGKGPYLAIMGEVFDVSSKADTYGPNGGYSFFSGKDASRAFVTGEFDDAGLIDDVKGLSHQDYLGLQEWGVHPYMTSRTDPVNCMRDDL